MTGIRIVLTTVLAALAVVLSSPATASAGEPFACNPDVYFELDAHGYVTAYPSAKCTGEGTFASIEVYHTLLLDEKLVEGLGHKRKYVQEKAGVYVGEALSARNPEGTNAFCSLVTVYWAHALDKVSHAKESRNCVNY